MQNDPYLPVKLWEGEAVIGYQGPFVRARVVLGYEPTRRERHKVYIEACYRDAMGAERWAEMPDESPSDRYTRGVVLAAALDQIHKNVVRDQNRLAHIEQDIASAAHPNLADSDADLYDYENDRPLPTLETILELGWKQWNETRGWEALEQEMARE